MTKERLVTRSIAFGAFGAVLKPKEWSLLERELGEKGTLWEDRKRGFEDHLLTSALLGDR